MDKVTRWRLSSPRGDESVRHFLATQGVGDNVDSPHGVREDNSFLNPISHLVKSALRHTRNLGLVALVVVGRVPFCALQLGHDARLMAPKFVTPYRKSGSLVIEVWSGKVAFSLPS
jgi:hypothetical protein